MAAPASALDRFGLLYQTAGDGQVVSPDDNYGNALAGTVALALLTELIYSHASGDDSFAGLRTAWLEGLLDLRIPGGGFRQTPLSIDDSDYDNGEAWLALAVYGEMHKDDLRSTSALSNLDDALMRRYSDHPSVNFFSWGAMAAAQRYRTTRDPKFCDYLRRQGNQFIGRFQRQLSADANNCAALEGIGAILAVLDQTGEQDTDLARAMHSLLSNEIIKLARLQIQPAQRGLALGGDAYLSAPRMAEYAGGFLAGVYEPLTRVDAAGHCLSAMVTIERDRLTVTDWRHRSPQKHWTGFARGHRHQGQDDERKRSGAGHAEPAPIRHAAAGVICAWSSAQSPIPRLR